MQRQKQNLVRIYLILLSNYNNLVKSDRKKTILKNKKVVHDELDRHLIELYEESIPKGIFSLINSKFRNCYEVYRCKNNINHRRLW